MKELSTCAHCGAPYVNGRLGVCGACGNFKRRNGRLPEAHEIGTRKQDFALCTNCQRAPAYRKTLCGACDRWQRLYGVPRPKYKWAAICTRCKEEKIHAKGLCRNCYQWQRNHHGKSRPRYKLVDACTNCGKTNVMLSKGRCQTCANYFRLRKRERPARLWQRWNPQTEACHGPVNRPCRNCGRPSTRHDGRDRARGLCWTCYRFVRLYGHDRPAQLWQRWAPQGWCECGRPAVTEVTLQVDHGATKYKLCNDCYRAEVGHD